MRFEPPLAGRRAGEVQANAREWEAPYPTIGSHPPEVRRGRQGRRAAQRRGGRARRRVSARAISESAQVTEDKLTASDGATDDCSVGYPSLIQAVIPPLRLLTLV